PTTPSGRAIEPELNPDFLGCMYMPLRAQADPKKATRAFAAAASRSGARIRTQYAVTTVEQRGDEMYLVETPHDTFIAGTLIIAAGAWCAEVGRWLGLHIPITPVRGPMAATEPAEPRYTHTLSPVHAALDPPRPPTPAQE